MLLLRFRSGLGKKNYQMIRKESKNCHKNFLNNFMKTK